MRKITLLSLVAAFLFTVNPAKAQDPKAKTILDKLKAKTESYSSIQIDFEYNMKNTSEDIDETQTGSLATKNKMYNVDIAGQNIISDGKTVWTVLPEAEEVQINDVPEDDESEDYISPDKLLKIWESGFKYKYDSQTTMNGSAVDVINLYPSTNDDKSFHTIKLFINKARTQIEQVIIKGKDGTDYTYKIVKFTPNKVMGEDTFMFSTSKNPDYDVIDLR